MEGKVPFEEIVRNKQELLQTTGEAGRQVRSMVRTWLRLINTHSAKIRLKSKVQFFFLQISTNFLRCDSCCRSWPGGWWSSRGCTACSSRNISKIDTTSKTIVNILERSTIARSSGGKSRRKMLSWKTSSVDLEFIENKTLGCRIILHGGGA